MEKCGKHTKSEQKRSGMWGGSSTRSKSQNYTAEACRYPQALPMVLQAPGRGQQSTSGWVWVLVGATSMGRGKARAKALRRCQ